MYKSVYVYEIFLNWTLNNMWYLYKPNFNKYYDVRTVLSLYCLISIDFIKQWGLPWSWSYGSWIYNYLCKQYLSPLMLWVQILLNRDVLDTTCDKVSQWLVTGQCFSTVSSTNKTDRHDITEILLKLALNTITLTLTLLNQWNLNCRGCEINSNYWIYDHKTFMDCSHFKKGQSETVGVMKI